MQKRIRELRRENSLTQKQAADYLKISQSYYSKLESGKRKLSTNIIKELSILYNTSMDYILKRTDIKQPYPKPSKK